MGHRPEPSQPQEEPPSPRLYFGVLDLWDDVVLSPFFVTVTPTKHQWWICRETMALLWAEYNSRIYLC